MRKMRSDNLTLRQRVLKSLKADDRGAAIVIVIVAMAFVGILGATIMWMALTNFRMKATDRSVKKSFYTAETVFEQIMTGLQEESAAATSYAYAYVLQNYSSWEDDKKQAEFQTEYVKKINETLAVSETDKTKFKVEALMKYVDDNLGVKVADSDEERWIGALDPSLTAPTGTSSDYLSHTGTIIAPTGSNYIILKGLHLEYTDNDGFLSIIDTDIMISAPSAMFTRTESLSDAFDYAIIADDSFNCNASGTVTVKGNIYAGEHGINIPSKLVINDSDYVITRGDITLESTATGFTIEKNTASANTDKLIPELWADNIEVNKGDVTLNSNSFINDDMTLSGSGSVVTINNSYIAYGNSRISSEDSSAIIVNGTENTIDMTGVENLLLAGRAFTSSKDYKTISDKQKESFNSYTSDFDKELVTSREGYKQKVVTDEAGNPVYDLEGNVVTENELDSDGNPIPVNLNNEIMLGESIAIKGDQVAYLVPDECIGIVSGISVGNKNPLTGSEYYEMMETGASAVAEGESFYEVDVNRQISRYNSLSLSDYGISTANISKIFMPSNGETLVYYYMDFSFDPDMADKFFYDYYNIHKDRFDNYFNVYASGGIKSASSYTRILIEGNYLTSTDSLTTVDALTLKPVQDVYIDSFNTDASTADAAMADQESLESEIQNYKDVYSGLTYKLTKNYSGLTAVEKGLTTNSNGENQGTVFTNIIDRKALVNYLHGGTKVFTLTGSTPEYKAVIADGDYTYNGDPDVILIICNGDVTINGDFKGIIFAGGRAAGATEGSYIDKGKVNVTGDYEIVSARNADLLSAIVSILQQPYSDTDDTRLIDFIRDAGDYIIAGTALKEDDDPTEMKPVDYEQLIRYQNWIKK